MRAAHSLKGAARIVGHEGVACARARARRMLRRRAGRTARAHADAGGRAAPRRGSHGRVGALRSGGRGDGRGDAARREATLGAVALDRAQRRECDRASAWRAASRTAAAPRTPAASRWRSPTTPSGCSPSRARRWWRRAALLATVDERRRPSARRPRARARLRRAARRLRRVARADDAGGARRAPARGGIGARAAAASARSRSTPLGHACTSRSRTAVRRRAGRTDAAVRRRRGRACRAWCVIRRASSGARCDARLVRRDHAGGSRGAAPPRRAARASRPQRRRSRHRAAGGARRDGKAGARHDSRRGAPRRRAVCSSPSGRRPRDRPGRRARARGAARARRAAAAAEMSEQELSHFLFLPGFTMRDAVTPISGRGVGLDAVQMSVREIGGDVRLVLAPSGGTRFEHAASAHAVRRSRARRARSPASRTRSRSRACIASSASSAARSRRWRGASTSRSTTGRLAWCGRISSRDGRHGARETHAASSWLASTNRRGRSWSTGSSASRSSCCAGSTRGSARCRTWAARRCWRTDRRLLVLDVDDLMRTASDARRRRPARSGAPGRAAAARGAEARARGGRFAHRARARAEDDRRAGYVGGCRGGRDGCVERDAGWALRSRRHRRGHAAHGRHRARHAASRATRSFARFR